MHTNFPRIVRTTSLLTLLFALTIGVPVAAGGPFIENNVVIIHSFTGEQPGQGFGWVGADLGDIDGDGANDFLLTAPFFGENSEGKVYVYSGKEGTLVHEIVGEAGALLGYSARGAGDVNADGTPDYIVGGPGAGGRAHVYSGADHTLLLDLSDTATDEALGTSVDGAGDVNGDGHADLVLGASRADISETITDTGRIYLLSGLDGSLLWSHDGDTPQGRFGSGIGGVGDVNGDDIPDQVAAAPFAGTHGQAHVLSGADGSLLFTLEPTIGDAPASGGTYGVFFADAAGDVNGDGTADIFIGDYAAQRGEVAGTGRAYIYSGVDGSMLHQYNAEADGDGLGPGRALPDIDGDGSADLILAGWQSSAGVENGGKIYIHSGMDQTLLHTVTGNIEADALGVDAFGVGDVNDDGQMDYMLTAVGNDFNSADVGRAYVVTFAKPVAEVEFAPILGGCQLVQPE
ncbi:integrin alpha [Chloroflexi bacterium TSY]|nr:integrin alpha [Chloroflexi bacterium TSY]